MIIPQRNLERFVRDLADECMISQTDRINRGAAFTNYALFGSDNPSAPAMYNKTYAYIDDLESLLYSPISLRFQFSDLDLPNLVEDAKGRAAAAKLRQFARKSDTDTMISEAVFWSLIKGKTILKTLYKRGAFSPELVQPESFGVLRENHRKLDEDMEAFVHTMYITPYQFRRLIYLHPDREKLERKARRYTRDARNAISPEVGAQKQIIVGGLYPFQAAGSGSPNTTRGIVDWMGGPSPQLAPNVATSLMRLDELWVWSDEDQDWITFQQIGEDMLIRGKYTRTNAFAYDPDTGQSDPELKGHHPFNEISANRLDGYFWGRSEVVNVALLQEAINARINGTAALLRRQEDPSHKFIGVSGVNQSALTRFRKPGGYFSDTNPNAKIETEQVQIPGDLWGSLHEYERMFDEMGGLPPIAKGRGEAGVRSQGHAETLVRMFSPRFKDRALMIERDVEGIGATMLRLAKAHEDKKLIAWVPKGAAGIQAPVIQDNAMIVPPAPEQVPVTFSFADLDDDLVLSIDSHSSSPAFSEEAKSLIFALFKIGAMSAEDVIAHVDAPDPEDLVAGVQRRQYAAAQAQKQQMQLKLIKGKGAG